MTGAEFTYHGFIITVFFWVAVVILCVGLCMMLAPGWILRLGQRLNQWISTDAFFSRLDTPKYGERFFYRHHILFGGFIILGGAYIFYRFMFAFNAASYSLPVFASTSANQWLTGSLVFMNILFSILMVIFGIVVILRPSLLKHFEAVLNRWFVTETSFKKLDMQMRTPDIIFIKRPRLTGLIIVAGSLYIVINLWSML
jgi:hypothetical protein